MAWRLTLIMIFILGNSVEPYEKFWEAIAHLRERISKVESELSPIKLAVFGLISLMVTALIVAMLKGVTL